MKRRHFLATGLAAGTALTAPSLIRAQAREIVIAGPSAQAKMFETDVQPIIEKRTGAKIVMDGSISVRHLQTMAAQRNAPTHSIAWMPDTDMVMAMDQGLIAPLDAGSVPNLGKLLPGSLRDDKMWVKMKIARFSIGVNTDKVKPPLQSWKELWTDRFRGKLLIPGFALTQGPMMLTAAAHAETGKPLAEAQYEIEAGFKRLTALKPNILNVFTASPQAIMLLEQGEAHAVVGLFSSVLFPRMRQGMPIDLPNPVEGAFGSPNCLALVNKGPHAALASAVIDAFLDADVQKVMMEKTFDSPVRGDVPLDPGVVAADKMVSLDAAFWGKRRAEIAPGYAAALA
ncbi:MAG: extracellular solute-binding protein [Alphaproteobacteria bacterium]|nr:extracellular solute-binding protein [Alphaproteobacteria bacterium]